MSLLLILLTCGLCQTSTRATTLTINRQITAIVHHFTPPNPPFPGVVNDEIIFDTAGLTNVDLSAYDTFELRLFAPPDLKVNVNRSTNFTSRVSLYYLAAGDSIVFASSNKLAFENFSGVSPACTYSNFGIGAAGNAINFLAYHAYSNEIKFTAIKYSFTPTNHPANSPKTFLLPNGATNLLLFNYVTSQTNDPGPFVTLSSNLNTLTIDRQITGIFHQFDPPNTPNNPGELGWVLDALILEEGGITNVDLSQYDRIKFRIHAPTGLQVVVTNPSEVPYGLFAWLDYRAEDASFLGNHDLDTNVSVNIENLFGLLPPFGSSGNFGSASNGSWLRLEASVGAFTNDLKFTGVEYVATPVFKPASSTHTLQPYLKVVLVPLLTHSATDPGQAVFLESKTNLTIHRQITAINHHFLPAIPPATPGYVTNEIIFDTADVTNENLSLYEFFELRLFAPGGQQVVLNCPTNFDSYADVIYSAGGFGAGQSASNNVLRFENFSGIVPVFIGGSSAISDDGNAMLFQNHHTYSNWAEFTAIRYGFVPISNPTNILKTFQLGGGAPNSVRFVYPTDQTNDPGPFVNLNPFDPLRARLNRTPGNATVSWKSRLNHYYQVESNTNFPAGSSWNNIGSPVIGDGLTNSVTDTPPPGPSLMYRIRVVPH